MLFSTPPSYPPPSFFTKSLPKKTSTMATKSDQRENPLVPASAAVAGIVAASIIASSGQDSINDITI